MASNYIWPISKSTAPDEMNTSYGPCIDGDRWDFHDGIDLPAPVGTKVHAMRRGTVHRAGPGEPDEESPGFHSRHVVLEVDDPSSVKMYLFYFHLHSIAEDITVGATVTQGQLLGTVGEDGATYPHLHIEFRKGTDRQIELEGSQPAKVVRTGRAGRERLDTPDESTPDEMEATVHATVVDPAPLPGEPTGVRFFELAKDNGRQTYFVGIAPHGGSIEEHTDQQAARVVEELSSVRFPASSWLCKGFGDDAKGAFDRWHITSTDLNPACFPRLRYSCHGNSTTASHFTALTAKKGMQMSMSAEPPRTN